MGGTEAAGWKAGGGAWRLEPICGIVTQPTLPALEVIERETAEVGGKEVAQNFYRELSSPKISTLIFSSDKL